MGDDWNYALCAARYCADVVNCVFDQETQPSLMLELHDRIRLWQAQVPTSFKPLAASDGFKTITPGFPNLALLSPCHGMSPMTQLCHSGQQLTYSSDGLAVQPCGICFVSSTQTTPRCGTGTETCSSGGGRES